MCCGDFEICFFFSPPPSLCSFFLPTQMWAFLTIPFYNVFCSPFLFCVNLGSLDILQYFSFLNVCAKYVVRKVKKMLFHIIAFSYVFLPWIVWKIHIAQFCLHSCWMHQYINKSFYVHQFRLPFWTHTNVFMSHPQVLSLTETDGIFQICVWRTTHKCLQRAARLEMTL